MTASQKTRKYQAYSPALAERVCELLVEGLFLYQIEKMAGMPSKRAILYWLNTYEDFRRKYVIARMMQAEALADEIMGIADDTSGDWIITEAGERIVNHEHINRTRERINTRKWLMSKWMPQRYGDKVTADITVRGDVKELSNAELLAIAGGGDDAGDGELEGNPDTTVH